MNGSRSLVAALILSSARAGAAGVATWDVGVVGLLTSSHAAVYLSDWRVYEKGKPWFEDDGRSVVVEEDVCDCLGDCRMVASITGVEALKVSLRRLQQNARELVRFWDRSLVVESGCVG